MAKSIRSKIKKRLRTAKRQRVDAMVRRPQEVQKHDALQRVIQGRVLLTRKPKNAFKYPDAPDAVFGQHEVQKPIDFRAQNLPMAGYAFRGNRRKYEGEEAEYMKMLAQSSHPKMEVLAGGGAILASSGQRISMREAELLAAAVQIGAAAAQAPPVAAPAPAEGGSAATVELTSDAAPDGAAAPAAAADAGAAVPASQEHLPEKTDHSRRPLVRDTRRAERVAARRPRSIATKKKGKQQAGGKRPGGRNAEEDEDDDDEEEASAGGAEAAPGTAAPAPMEVDSPPQQGQEEKPGPSEAAPAAGKARGRKAKKRTAGTKEEM